MLRLFGLKPIKLRWVINICLTTAVWFIASILYQGKYRVTVFLVLIFVKRFVWYCLFFTQYSYYCDFFCSGPAPRLHDCHSHRWVRYIDTTKITVWCMSPLLLSIDLRWFVTLSCFILNCHRTFLFSQILNPFICGIFEHTFFCIRQSNP